MPNVSALLKEEITRLARKEIRKETEALKSASARYRSEIAALKRHLELLEKSITCAARAKHAQPAVRPDSEDSGTPRRYSAAGLKKLRARLDISAQAFGQLVGVTGQTVYKWESGSTRPHATQIEAIAVLRKIGKRELASRLAAAPAV